MTDKEMREPTFMVLAALANGPKHGYALIKEADELSHGRVQLKVGTLYSALDRLQAEGLVTTSGEEIVDGRRRRYFSLTENGSSELESEIIRMEQNAREARLRIRHASIVTAVRPTAFRAL
jgi:PadR family transcriptional regulator PadR